MRVATSATCLWTANPSATTSEIAMPTTVTTTTITTITTDLLRSAEVRSLGTYRDFYGVTHPVPTPELANLRFTTTLRTRQIRKIQETDTEADDCEETTESGFSPLIHVADGFFVRVCYHSYESGGEGLSTEECQQNCVVSRNDRLAGKLDAHITIGHARPA
jgi:hypothetical protein